MYKSLLLKSLIVSNNLKLIITLPSDVRYFLIKFLDVYGVDQYSKINYKALAKKFGVTDRVVTKSINYLVNEKQLIIQNKIETKGKGRKRSQFKVGAELIASINQGGSVIDRIHHIKLIQDILSIETKHSLKALNKLLMIVLLANATKTGVVNTLGKSDLRKLTGMTNDQLESQLNKLHKIGYIRRTVSGTTGEKLFGRVNSVYFLNLLHPDYSSSVKTGSLYLLHNLSFEQNEAQNLFIYAKRKNRNGYQFSNLLNECSEFFTTGFDQLVHDYLQMKIEEYALQLISYYLLEKKPEIKNAVYEKIRKEIIPDKYCESEEEAFPTEAHKTVLVELIFTVSSVLTKRILRLLKSTFKESLYNSSSDYIKHHNDTRFLCLEIHNKQDKGVCYYKYSMTNQRLEELKESDLLSEYKPNFERILLDKN